MNKIMSLLSIWLASTEQKDKGVRRTVQIIFWVLLAVAVFLAVKDMGLLQHTSTKIWVLLLAITFPELYIILHGISTSSMGVSFFTGSPVESKMGADWYKPHAKSWGHGDVDSSSLSEMKFDAAPKPPPMATPGSTDSSSLF
jgi:hypothetical protein